MRNDKRNLNRTIKMKDVARLANVSPSTVSRVLSNSSLVADQTRQRVLEAIERLNYRPNRLGRNLRKLASKIVMVIFPDITNPFFSKVIQGVEDIARQKGYFVLIGDTRNDVNLEREFLGLGKEKLVDGILLTTARVPKEEITSTSYNVPLVLACAYIEENSIPEVLIDNEKAAYDATEHLIRLGHKKIALITGPGGRVLRKVRLSGYKKACRENNIVIHDSLLFEGDYTLDSGDRIMKGSFAANKFPTAVFAAHDEMAGGAIKAI